ncbi:AfsR/SARP family transcriptional regulator [Streptomyces xanthochromogenes]|uniref:AfsR/SARP family transcriptional regulator n=1 Tax=Streptomyces xanthochromogenes TaxID=67384 RepID=UPI00341CEE8F
MAECQADKGGPVLSYGLLGPLALIRSGQPVTVPRGPKVRQLLGLFLCRANRPVSLNDLVDELWGENPPDTAEGTLRTHVHRLRRFLESEGPQSGLLQTRSAGYLLRVAPGLLDAESFEQAARQGRELSRARHWDEAADRLRQALGLWRGPALDDVAHGRLLSEHVAHLEELRTSTTQAWIEAERELGHHRELIPELRALVEAHPLNEWLHEQLIDLLALCGRRPEALDAYRRLWHVLDDELGLEPSPALQRLHHRILTPAHPAPARPAPARATGRALGTRTHHRKGTSCATAI